MHLSPKFVVRCSDLPDLLSGWVAGTIRAGRKKRTWALNAGRDTDPDTRPMLTMPIILMLTTRRVIKGNEGDQKWEFMDARERRLGL